MQSVLHANTMLPVTYILLNTQRNNNIVIIQAYTCL